MSVSIFFIIVFVVAILAGVVGALTGLGGGIIIVPILSLGLGVPLKFAMAASLISVIGTSSGAAAAYVKEGITNLQIGMFLQIATIVGSILGAILVVYVNISVDILGIIFGIVLIITALLTAQKKPDHLEPIQNKSLSYKLQLYGKYQSNKEELHYSAVNPLGGTLVMTIAGFLSGLLGVGGGVFKVLAMDNIMRLPFKVSTTTSNFMIGVTALASAIIYFSKGFVNPLITAPILLGIIIGARLGAKFLIVINVLFLKRIFSIIVAIIAIYMIYNGLNGNFKS